MLVKYKYLTKKLFYRLTRRLRLSVGENTIIDRHAVIDIWKKGRVRIGRNSFVHGHAIINCYSGAIVTIGDNVSINPFCVLYGIGDLTIGNGVRIAAHTVIIPANHIYADAKRYIYEQGITRKGIVIEDDVWIGANATVLDGVRIGTHCVIGAGSVVSRSIPPHSLAVGVPCRVIKSLAGDGEAKPGESSGHTD